MDTVSFRTSYRVQSCLGNTTVHFNIKQYNKYDRINLFQRNFFVKNNDSDDNLIREQKKVLEDMFINVQVTWNNAENLFYSIFIFLYINFINYIYK